VIDLNTGFRAIRTFALVCFFASAALGQSVLNFPARDLTRVVITNTSPYAADIKFTLYNADGSPATTGVLNPVSRRVPSKGQLPVIPSEIFRMTASARLDTWIQASSSVSGLEAFYSLGDVKSQGSGGEVAKPQTVQTIPFVSSDSRATATLLVTNPSAQATNFTVNFYSPLGGLLGTNSVLLPAHAQAEVATPQRATSARILSDVAVVATAVDQLGDSQVLINGLGPRAQAQVFVAPFFKNSENTTSQLLLVNSSNVDAQATVTFFTDLGAQQLPSTSVPLRANGSEVVSAPVDGWLLVESTVPIGGLVIVTSGNSRSTLPLQTAPAERMLFSRFHDDELLNSTLNLVGAREGETFVTITLSRPDGTTIAKRDNISMSPLSRLSAKLSQLVPLPEGSSEGYVTVQSTAPVFGLELINGNRGAAVAAVSPQDLPTGFQASAVATAPRILSIDSLPADADGVRRISIVGQNFDSNATLTIGGRIVPMAPTSINGRFTAELPELEAGYINVKVRVGGLESPAYLLAVLPDDVAFVQRSGQAMFQKIEVSETGLDPSRVVMVPIRNARVEVFDPINGQPVSVSETNEQGEFLVAVPADRFGLAIRVLSRPRSSDVRVLDNMSGNRLYSLSRDLGNPRATDEIDLIDTTRVSGAFNILDNVLRANALIASSDPQFTPPPLTIYWSERNTESVLARLTQGKMRSTFFSLVENAAYILGDRDSDEFDDSVILHEYAHMLAARFSRDDSRGGLHNIGDMLDPRVAWSEGWANFFSSAVRGTSVYIDSKGPGQAFRYDLEEDFPANDRPGYHSEASVGGILWDLLDENQDNGDTAQFPFASIWMAFADLRNVRYVYLPYFLEAFLERNPGSSEALRAIVIRRNPDFQPDERPSARYPFPQRIGVGQTVGGEVDSFTSKRTNLSMSSHFWSFSTPLGGLATITLNFENLGPANNPNANDLGLYLLDGNGKRIEWSDRGQNGQAEMISVRLNPGTYYIEVRSYYGLEGTNTTVFNSGRYRLSLQLR
jgi:hypothetical protein